jgi:hypothetical protein
MGRLRVSDPIVGTGGRWDLFSKPFSKQVPCFFVTSAVFPGFLAVAYSPLAGIYTDEIFRK